MKSMTGYGSGRAPLGEGVVVVDLRAANHRYLDARVRLPSRAQRSAPAVERVIRARLERGRVEATARFEGASLPQPSLDVERARKAFEELAALRDALSPDEPLPLSLLSCVPELFTANREVDENALNEALGQATEEACSSVDAMRSSEGASLASDLKNRLEEVARTVEQLRSEVPRVSQTRTKRLRDRLDALLQGVDAELEPGRLEQEIAILAERSDITEELVRLESHREQMLELIDISAQPVGKRVDFLLQEMAREANTVGAKVQDGSMTTLVIELKAAVEQMREQAQNVL